MATYAEEGGHSRFSAATSRPASSNDTAKLRAQAPGSIQLKKANAPALVCLTSIEGMKLNGAMAAKVLPGNRSTAHAQHRQSVHFGDDVLEMAVQSRSNFCDDLMTATPSPSAAQTHETRNASLRPSAVPTAPLGGCPSGTRPVVHVDGARVEVATVRGPCWSSQHPTLAASCAVLRVFSGTSPRHDWVLAGVLTRCCSP